MPNLSFFDKSNFSEELIEIFDIADISGSFDIVEEEVIKIVKLINNLTSEQAVCTWEGLGGNTFLTIAVKSNSPLEIIEALLQKEQCYVYSEHFYKAHNKSMNLDGLSPAHFAIKNNNLECLKLLYEYKVGCPGEMATIPLKYDKEYNTAELIQFIKNYPFLEDLSENNLPDPPEDCPFDEINLPPKYDPSLLRP